MDDDYYEDVDLDTYGEGGINDQANAPIPEGDSQLMEFKTVPLTKIIIIAIILCFVFVSVFIICCGLLTLVSIAAIVIFMLIF